MSATTFGYLSVAYLVVMAIILIASFYFAKNRKSYFYFKNYGFAASIIIGYCLSFFFIVLAAVGELKDFDNGFIVLDILTSVASLGIGILGITKY